jgi:hypothetical protein
VMNMNTSWLLNSNHRQGHSHMCGVDCRTGIVRALAALQRFPFSIGVIAVARLGDWKCSRWWGDAAAADPSSERAGATSVRLAVLATRVRGQYVDAQRTCASQVV